MKHLLLRCSRQVVLKTLHLEIFTLSFDARRQRILLNCVPHVQHDYVPLGLAKLGNIVAETLLRMQMFPNLAARETCVAETNFAARKTKNVFAWSQKHLCFPDKNFASETYVSQFSQPGKHNKKHCFRNNVS